MIDEHGNIFTGEKLSTVKEWVMHMKTFLGVANYFGYQTQLFRTWKDRVDGRNAKGVRSQRSS